MFKIITILAVLSLTSCNQPVSPDEWAHAVSVCERQKKLVKVVAQMQWVEAVCGNGMRIMINRTSVRNRQKDEQKQ